MQPSRLTKLNQTIIRGFLPVKPFLKSQVSTFPLPLQTPIILFKCQTLEQNMQYLSQIIHTKIKPLQHFLSFRHLQASPSTSLHYTGSDCLTFPLLLAPLLNCWVSAVLPSYQYKIKNVGYVRKFTPDCIKTYFV